MSDTNEPRPPAGPPLTTKPERRRRPWLLYLAVCILLSLVIGQAVYIAMPKFETGREVVSAYNELTSPAALGELDRMLDELNPPMRSPSTKDEPLAEPDGPQSADGRALRNGKQNAPLVDPPSTDIDGLLGGMSMADLLDSLQSLGELYNGDIDDLLDKYDRPTPIQPAPAPKAKPARAPKAEIACVLEDAKDEYVVRIKTTGVQGLTVQWGEKELAVTGTVTKLGQPTPVKHAIPLPGPVKPETMTFKIEDQALVVTVDKAVTLQGLRKPKPRGIAPSTT